MINTYIRTHAMPPHAPLHIYIYIYKGARSGIVVKTLHYTTNRQVAGSIPDGVIGIFQLHNPSGHTVALGLTQPLTEVSTRCISWW
jgi:hypothetical protein